MSLELYLGFIAATLVLCVMPGPVVTVESVSSADGGGLSGMLRLSFPVAVAGPVILGRTRHLGGGLFSPVTG